MQDMSSDQLLQGLSLCAFLCYHCECNWPAVSNMACKLDKARYPVDS